jgi:hypothetical protein
MKSRVYLETTIVSYLTALPSPRLVQAAHQQITHEWWIRRNRFEIYVSQAVIREAARGHAEAADRRLAALEGVPLLAIGADVLRLAERLLQARLVPAKAEVDAVHIAVAAIHGMDYLLTWNCSHIANAATRGKIEQTFRDLGLHPPLICTPEELLED